MIGPDHRSSLECEKLKNFISKIQDINYSTFYFQKKNNFRRREKTQKSCKKKFVFFLEICKKIKL